jgi:hypothetical protein
MRSRLTVLVALALLFAVVRFADAEDLTTCSPDTGRAIATGQTGWIICAKTGPSGISSAQRSVSVQVGPSETECMVHVSHFSDSGPLIEIPLRAWPEAPGTFSGCNFMLPTYAGVDTNWRKISCKSAKAAMQSATAVYVQNQGYCAN